MRTLGSNAIYNILYKSLNALFPLVTMAYVSRVLLPVGVGKVASAQNIVSYFVIIASLGLPTYGVKKIAECFDEREKRSRTFSELAVINAISTLICICVYLGIVLGIDYFEDKLSISFIVGIQLFANIFNIDWFYQGIEEYRYIMFRSFIVKLLALASVFIFVHNVSDFLIYALIVTLSFVANYIFNVINLHKYVDFQYNSLDVNRHLKPVFILLATTIAIEIYTLTDTTMLSLFRGDEVVGYYTNSAKTVGIARVMITAASAVFLPRLNYYLSHGRELEFESLAFKGLSMLFTLSLPVAVGLMLLAEDCTLIMFGKEFEATILSMQILTVSVVTIAISNFTGYQILVSLGKETIVLYSTIIGAIINVVLNVLLIMPYGHYGAAIASVVTEFVIAAYQLYYVNKYISLSLKSIVKQTFLPLVAMVAVVYVTKLLFDNIYIQTVIAVILGSITYLFLCIVSGNETIILLKNKCKK